MFYLLKIFFKDPWILAPLIISLLSQFFMWPYIISQVGGQEGRLFLHYNIIFGVDYVGEWWRLLLLPVAALVFLTINYAAALFCYNTDKLLSRLLTFFTAIIGLFFCLAVYLIVDINL